MGNIFVRLMITFYPIIFSQHLINYFEQNQLLLYLRTRFRIVDYYSKNGSAEDNRPFHWEILINPTSS